MCGCGLEKGSKSTTNTTLESSHSRNLLPKPVIFLINMALFLIVTIFLGGSGSGVVGAPVNENGHAMVSIWSGLDYFCVWITHHNNQ